MAMPFYLSIILTISVISAAHSELQCYVCVDCPLAEASNLMKCSALTSTNATTTETSTSASSDTTTNSPPIVANPSTVTDLPTATNTASANNTPAVTSPITTVSPTSTSSVTTTASTTNTSSTAPATAYPITSTASQANTTSLSSSSSSMGGSSPVTASNNFNSFTDSPIFVISPALSNSLNPTVKPISRKKRFAKEDPSSDKECICNNGKCDCNYSRLSSVHLNDLRAVKYQCYKHKHTVNGTEVIDRGCKEITNGTSETACSLLNATEGCYHCDTDKCNSAFSLQYSIVLCILCLTIVSNMLK